MHNNKLNKPCDPPIRTHTHNALTRTLRFTHVCVCIPMHTIGVMVGQPMLTRELFTKPHNIYAELF